MGEIAELVQDLLELRCRGPRAAPRPGDPPPPTRGQPDPDAQGDQVLLGPVMKVALDSAALGVAGGHDARARGAELCGRRLELGHPDGRSRRRAAAPDPPPSTSSGSVFNAASCTMMATVSPLRLTGVDERPGPGAGERLAARVDEATALVEPEAELDRRIIERIGQGRAQLGGVRVVDQPAHDRLQRGRGEEGGRHDRKQKSEGERAAGDRDDPAHLQIVLASRCSSCVTTPWKIRIGTVSVMAGT